MASFNSQGFSQEASSQQSFTSSGFSQGNSTQTSFSQGGFVDTSVPIAPKRLVVCCDGTWQSSVSGLKNIPSNVTRLARSVSRSGKDKDGKVWQQIVHYDAGIGTGELSKDEKDRQGGFGVGFVGNVIEAYNFIVLNYNRGDEIFCFGFSRGAYTARAVAGLVTDIGVIAPRDMQDFPDLYALYQSHKDSLHFRKSTAYRDWVNGVLADEQPAKVQGGFQEPPRWKQHPHRPAPEASREVQVVGVFDTVGSLGIPDLTWTSYNLKFLEKFVGIPNPGFHNVSLSPYVKNAFHALALDEHRGPFTPTLWHFPVKGDQSPPKPAKSLQELWGAWNDLNRSQKASKQELAAAWGNLVDGEMYEKLKGLSSTLVQVWFPGVHINIGGGSDDLLTDRKGDFEQIALISFAWMCEQVAPHLELSKDIHWEAVEDRSKLIRPLLDEIEKGEKDYGNHALFKNAWKVLDKTGVVKAQTKKIEDGVVNGWATGPIVDSFQGGMALAGSIVRTPGDYERKLGPTYEYIHPSVTYRMRKVANYKPEALKGFTRSEKPDEKNRYVWTKGDIKIPEYLIKAGDSFTRCVAQQDSYRTDGNAADFIGGIDRQVGAKTSEAESLDAREKR